MIRKLRSEKQQIDKDQTDIDRYREETGETTKKIQELETGFVHIFPHSYFFYSISRLVPFFAKILSAVHVKWIWTFHAFISSANIPFMNGESSDESLRSSFAFSCSVVLMQSNPPHLQKSPMNVRYVRKITSKSFKSLRESGKECGFPFRKWLHLINNQRVGKDIHENFHRELDERQDKFGVVAEFLGRRLFDKVILHNPNFHEKFSGFF